MRLLAKFNLVFITTFACALFAVCVIADDLDHRNARREVIQQGRLLLETAGAMRGYTATQIEPLLVPQFSHRFLPQAVTSYATAQLFNGVRKKYPLYMYREPAINPKNLQNRATDWETDIITSFKNHPKETEVSTIRMTPMGQTLYICHPIRVDDRECLTCHGSPADAPKTMIASYGSDNGFGYKLGDIVAVQEVAVPMSVPQQVARQTFLTLMSSLIVVFVITMVVLNIMLVWIVVRPVTDLSQRADEISKGNIDVEELQARGKDEIAGLASSFNRMMRSLKKAITMLDPE